jgi:hypothetical protein
VLNNKSLNASHVLLAAGKENLILNGGDELRAKLTQLEDLHKKGALLTAAAHTSNPFMQPKPAHLLQQKRVYVLLLDVLNAC